MKIFVVIPAFNEEKRIGKVLSQVENMGFDMIVVDDGSGDKTTKIAKSYTPYVYKHAINLGKGAALKTGCEAAFSLGANAVIIMDSDGQHKASDLPKFVKALGKDKVDVVFGKRQQGKIPVVRRLGNKLITFLVGFAFDISVGDILCGFKAFSLKAYKKINWESLGYSVETEIVAMTGKHKLSNCEVSVATVYYDKFKGLTVQEGGKILLDILKFKLLR